MSKINTTELKKAFIGMSDRESATHQVTYWEQGIPLHNPVRDECCPDFSCCGSPMMPQEARTRLLEAYVNGEHETVEKICMMGLAGITAEMNVDIAGEDPTEN